MRRSLALLLATAMLSGAAAPALADEMSDVYAKILANPTDPAANLQYAQLAEAQGDYKRALATYERMLLNDPNNKAALEGLQRIRLIVEPAKTQKNFEVGLTSVSNPLLEPVGSADVYAYGSFGIRDERVAGGQRFRTNLNLCGEAYANTTSMDYASLSADFGPVWNVPKTETTFRPAIGLGTAYFDGHVYYGDVNASGLFEGYLNGAYQWLRLRAGYRSYDPSFTSGSGAYADVTGKFAVADVLGENDSLSVAPWFRWSGINGTPDNGADDFATGLYIEGGATFEYAAAFNDWLSGAVNVRLSDRKYNDIGAGSREDRLVAPGAALVFTNLLSPQTDLRLAYRYEWNDSSDPNHTYQNQVATVSVVVRR
jgi:hypothetical protein